MYSLDRKQFIFKQSNGTVKNFYYDDRHGICYSTLSKRNTWSEPISIKKSVYPTFFADIDERNIFHILCQDSKGNIIYICLNGDSVRSIPVLNSRIPTPYEKNMFILPSKNNLNIFFTVEHNLQTILSHQILSDNVPQSPKVISYIPKVMSPFSVVSDRADNLYAFFQASDDRHLQVGYKKYSANRNAWGDFITVTNFSGDCEIPKCLIDNLNTLHLCFQRRTGKLYELVYKSKGIEASDWTDDLILHSSTIGFFESSILFANDIIYAFWVWEDGVYYTSSKDSGKHWISPSKVNFPNIKQVYCASYKSNLPNERVMFRETPATFSNGFKFPFLVESSSSNVALTSEELKNILLDSLSMLKTSVDELKNNYSDISNRLHQVFVSQQNLENEVTKNSLRINIIENDISGLKSLNNRSKTDNFSTTNQSNDPTPTNSTELYSSQKSSDIAEDTGFSTVEEFKKSNYFPPVFPPDPPSYRKSLKLSGEDEMQSYKLKRFEFRSNT